ncbi:MAG: D-alanine--D-alanine ligase [Desulfovibrio sp.]|nr:D-alanine--D-alanine ligase [Desulfovibrio sp.]
MKILLIAGGWSTEREVSLNGARAMRETLEKRGHTVTFLDLRADFDRLLETASHHDFALINLHGRPGEDGLVQALLERVGCPYQGTGPAGSFLALNKCAAKQVFRYQGLPTADWEFLPSPPPSNWRPSLPFPLFVKSNTGGSSLRTGRAANMAELKSVCSPIFEAGDEVLLEPILHGREITCGVLDETPLPPILIEPVSGDFFDYTSKYATGGAREICPAPISPELTCQVQKLALAAHKALDLRGYSRTDFILSSSNTLTILEINTLPGMTATSLIPQEAAAIGLDFGQLLEKLIELGLEHFHAKRSSH